jgi:branched-chain amino acid transport system substrate-binding protein
VPVTDALTAVEQLITQRGARVILGGPVRSEAAIAAMDTVSRNQVVQILTTGALSPTIHRNVAKDYEKYKYTFRITGEAGGLAREARDILTHIRNEFGFNKTYIMIQNVAHAVAIGNGLRALLGAAGGWEVYPTAGPATFATGETNYQSALREAESLGVQILFVWMDHPETSILMRQWHDLGIKALPVTGINSAMEVPTAWTAAGDFIKYVIASPVNTGNAVSNYSAAKAFYSAFEAKWLAEPDGYGTVSSYAAVYVLKAAIERAGSLEANALIEALEATDYMGPYGRIRFNETHQVISNYDPQEGAVGCWFQWIDGSRDQVWPRSVAVREIQVPPWMVTPPP